MATANLDIAEKLDIVCKRGDSFNMTITMTDSAGTAINLTGYTFSMEVKNRRIEGGRVAGINNQLVYEGTVLSNGVINKSTPGADGTVTFSVPASTMASVNPGVYVYDIQYFNSNNDETRTILEGLFKINPDVSLTA